MVVVANVLQTRTKRMFTCMWFSPKRLHVTELMLSKELEQRPYEELAYREGIWLQLFRMPSNYSGSK